MKYVAIALVIITVALAALSGVTSSPKVTTISTATPRGAAGVMGTITGKLCFPSEFLPAGSIEAKNVSTNSISLVEPYEGSENGAGSEYSVSLVAGTYILRYAAKPSASGDPLYGYHTTTCPTGMETSCAAENPREHIQIKVMPGETVENIDLCDFYYDPSNPPEF